MQLARHAQPPQAPASARPLAFGSSLIPSPLALLAPLQFPLIGSVIDKQCQAIYAVQIGGRIGESREFVEAREHATRDGLGASTWFWGVPIFQRLFLMAFAPTDIKKVLLLDKPAPQALAQGANWFKKGLHQLDKFNYHVLHNPLARYDLVSLEQLHNRSGDLERLWATAHSGLEAGAKHSLEAPAKQYLTRLLHWRKGAMGLGLAFTLGALGVGINLLNIFITKQQIQRELASKAAIPKG
jgi:hypothetical protein